MLATFRLRDEPHESSKLLAALDSFELMSQITSRVGGSSKTPTLSLEAKCVNAYDNPSSSNPSYMRSQKKSLSKAYKLMTDDDWNKLERAQQLGIEKKTSRQSFVWFDESLCIANSKCSNKSLILKQTKTEAKPEIDDALRPIHQKCRDLLGNMKL